jgi:hypothetical protein
MSKIRVGNDSTFGNPATPYPSDPHAAAVAALGQAMRDGETNAGFNNVTHAEWMALVLAAILADPAKIAALLAVLDPVADQIREDFDAVDVRRRLTTTEGVLHPDCDGPGCICGKFG